MREASNKRALVEEEQPINALLALERDECSCQFVGLDGGALAADGAGGEAVLATILVTLQSPVS